MKSLKRTTLVIASLIAIAVSFIGSPQANAAFNANNLMDDSIFNNSGSMSVTDIQNFLNQFPSSCLKNLVVPFPNNYFSYGGGVTAATAIRRVSDLWDINPQVILATLEKESSVVTGNASYGCTYLNTSMGYNCPDNGACPANPADAGFSQQITKGGWLLKMAEERANGRVNYDPPLDPDDDRNYYYSGPMTQGNRQRRFDAPNQYYDGLLNIDGQTVHMDTGATASFYFYTPHFHGNQNLVSIFERWFGPTTGTILLKGSGPTIYVRGDDSNTLYAIPSGDILKAYGWQGIGVTGVSDAYINSFTTKQVLTTLYLKPGDGTIYLADHGRAAGIPSGAVCVNWNLPCNQASLVATLPTYITNRIPVDHALGNLMVLNSTTFLVSGGVRKPFVAASDLRSSPYASESPTFIESPVNTNQTVGPPALYSSHFYRLGSSGAIYYYDAGASQHFTFNSFDSFKNWWDGSDVAADWFSSFNNSPPSSIAAADFVKYNGTNYVMAASKLALPSQPPNVTPLDTATYTGLQPLVQRKPTITIDSSTALRTPDGSIFALQSNNLLPIPTLSDLLLLFPAQKVYNVPNSLTSAYNVGKFYVSSGRVVKLSGSPAISLYGSDNYLWGVPSSLQVNALLRWVPNVIETGASNVNSAGNKAYVSLIKLNSSYYAIEADGASRVLPTSYLSSQKDDYAMPLTDPVASKLVPDPKGISFIHFDNGTIFALQNNSIHPLSQFSTYTNMGGSLANTLELPAAALPAFNIGSAL